MADIDVGQLSEVINDKADRDLRNVNTTLKADAVIDYQIPTAENNYTWYRLYASGWIEQGGHVAFIDGAVSLIKEMADNNYSIILSGYDSASQGSHNDSSCSLFARDITTIGFNIRRLGRNTTFGGSYWQVSGMSAGV